MSTKKTHHVKVEGTNFIRDTNTMGLSNRDLTAKNEYMMKVKMLKTQKEEINNVKSEMSQIKNELAEVKELLIQFLGKGRNG
jgi:hypothetical protein